MFITNHSSNNHHKKQIPFIHVNTTIIVIKLHIRIQQQNSIHAITTSKYQSLSMYKFTINNRHLAYSHQQHRQHQHYQIIIKRQHFQRKSTLRNLTKTKQTHSIVSTIHMHYSHMFIVA